MNKVYFDNCKRDLILWCLVNDLPILAPSSDEHEENSASYSSEYSYSEQEESFYMIVYCDI